MNTSTSKMKQIEREANAALESRQLPDGKNDLVCFDTLTRGFGIRIRRLRSGSIRRYWILQYRFRSHARRLIIGDADIVSAIKAREKAKAHLGKIADGHDPQVERREQREHDAHTLRSVITDFLDAKTDLKPNSLVSLKRYLGSEYLTTRLLSMPINEVTKRDVASRVLAVQKDCGVRASICFRSAVSNLFVWAMQMGLAESNPVIGAVRPKPPKSRDRVLKDAELGAIWRACRDDDYGRIVKLLILTGARRQEIGGMQRSEFSDDGSTWTLPTSRSKNGKAHTLPVTPMMREILDPILERGGRDHLFGRRRWGFTGWSIGKRALDQALDLKPWRVHDIRRSVSTGANDIGIQPHIVETILGHALGGVHGTYNRSIYANEVRDALLRWSDHVRAIIEGGERKVVAFERQAVASTP